MCSEVQSRQRRRRFHVHADLDQDGVLSWAAAGATAHFSSVVVEPGNATTDSACSAVPQGKSEAEDEGGPAAVRLTVREGYAPLLQPPRPLLRLPSSADGSHREP